MGKPSHHLANTSGLSSKQSQRGDALGYVNDESRSSHSERTGCGRICQRVGMKSERGAQLVWFSD